MRYFCNVYEDGFVTVWLSRQTAAFDRRMALSVDKDIRNEPRVMVVVRMKSGAAAVRGHR